MMYQSQFIEMFGNPLSQVQKFPLKRLGDCCELNPRRPSINLSDTDLVSFVPMPCVSENGYMQDVADEEYGKVKKGFTYFKNKDVLFAKITPCMENGKGAIAQELTNGIGMGSTEFHVLRPIEGKSNSYWLLALTRMPIFRERASKNMSGTGGQKRVGAPFLDNFMVGLPPIEEQNHFEELYRQADKSKFVCFKSQFIEMFGSKTSGAKWPMKCLSEIVDPNCPISYGIVQPGEELEEGVPIVRPVDLNSNYYVYKDGLKRTTEAISNSYKRTILRGDELLLCVRGTTGVMGLATDELKGGNVTRGITPLYFKEGFNRIYLLGAFLSDDVQAYIKDNTVGSTLKGINMEKVRKIQIPIPPIELQNKWETVFHRADKSKYSCQNNIKALTS